MFPTASPHCPIAGESRTDLARRRVSYTLKFRHAGWVHAALSRSQRFDGWCTARSWRFRWFGHQLPNTPLFTPSPSVSHNPIGTPETVGGRESASGFTRGLPAPQTPACHVSLDNFVRLKIAPRVLDAVARKRNDVGSVVINTEQFDWRSVGRKLIDDERRDPIA